jgi:hypothetical protein
VSKSSFLLLFLLVAFLAAAAGLQSGGARWGEVRSDIRYEARADIDAVKDDVYELRAQAKSAPSQLRSLWKDASNDLRVLKADVSIEARLAAERLSTLIKST